MKKTYLITFNPLAKKEIENQLKLKKIRFRFFQHINGVASLDLSRSEAEMVRQSPLVDTIEEDAVVYALAEEFAGSDSQRIPNDLGESVLVYVVDTGVNCINTIDRVNFHGDKNELNNAHGTHVAGTINIIIPKSSIISVQVLGGKMGSGSTKTIIDGINFIFGDIAKRNNYKYIFINMSLGMSHKSPAMCNAVSQTLENKVMTFVAAGNSSNNKVGSPANCLSVITVGSISRQGKLSTFSDYETNKQFGEDKPELLTVGENVMAHNHNTCKVDTLMTGTSMACPIALSVAGAVVSDLHFNVPAFRSMSTAEFQQLQKIIIQSGQKYLDRPGNILTYPEARDSIRKLYDVTMSAKQFRVYQTGPTNHTVRHRNPKGDPYLCY